MYETEDKVRFETVEGALRHEKFHEIVGALEDARNARRQQEAEDQNETNFERKEFYRKRHAEKLGYTFKPDTYDPTVNYKRR
jgi:hypothetical protein